ncbi:Glucomannan 4-beta-mannosyltransferase [Musa troglodytarum]|uniref:glucomannan 4-beta-mannosyltransferase n=2 Tax=Musa troglodytarum TaxID=320322 RepID=A0A9E7EK99_9LILI|nr:Glucomannan 4-beta-mannosyltransferase [Musa troglodytarum]
MVIFKKEPAVTRLSVISTQALAESRGGREREREEEEEEEEEEEPRVMEGSVSTTVARYIDRTYDLLSSPSTAEALSRVAAVFEVVRAGVLVPLLKVAVVLCLIMSVMLVIEKLSMAIIALYVKVFRRTPEKIYKWAPLSQDPELGSLSHPMVLIQIPMFNEREVYQISIGAVCKLVWPHDRLIIQVLDDSTDLSTRELVQEECQKWSNKGRNIHYISRDNRNGYKAGAMKEAMDLDYVKKCDYVAIFDADHEPPPDFLLRAIPFLMHNSDIALVQARWKFVNANECIMTRIQEMSLNYHFKMEQQSGSSTMAFFGFNGTAGVWRIQAINEAEGWKERTTVEDMDLAVRASLQGWKFVYIGDLKVKSELPSSYKAYRYQQHRWSCGPANLFKKMTIDIIMAKKVSLLKKLFLLYNFFFARRIISHNVTFLFYCIVIPFSSFFPEVIIPKWGVFYIPTVITILNSIGTPRSLHLIIIWIFFENVMSLHRCKAVFIGLFEAGRVNEWVVTEKLGKALKTKQVSTAAKRSPNKFWQRCLFLELGMAVVLLICALYNFIYRSNQYFIFIFPLSLSYFLMGFGFVGTHIPAAKAIIIQNITFNLLS